MIITLTKTNGIIVHSTRFGKLKNQALEEATQKEELLTKCEGETQDLLTM